MKRQERIQLLVRGSRYAAGLAIVAFQIAAAPVWAKDFCCPCENGQMISVDERNSMMATMKCSLMCKDATRAVSGQCKVAAAEPPKAPAAEAAPVQKGAAGGEVLLFATDDCSGDSKTVTASSSDISSLAADGLYSFQVASGGPASVWSNIGFAGSRTQPVVPSLCVSPGFQIKSVRIGTD